MRKCNILEMHNSKLNFIENSTEAADTNIQLILEHPFIITLTLDILNTNKLYIYLKHYIRFLHTVGLTLEYTANNLILGSSGSSQFKSILLRIMQEIRYAELVIIKPLVSSCKNMVVNTFKNYDETMVKNTFIKYRNYIVKLCKSNNLHEFFAFILSLYNIYNKIGLYMKANMKELNNNKLFVINWSIYYTSRPITESLQQLTNMCNDLASSNDSAKHEQMYQAFKDNLLYLWLVLNDGYYMPHRRI